MTSFYFKIGTISCWSVLDDSEDFTPPEMLDLFPEIPGLAEEVEKLPEHMLFCRNALLIQTGDDYVLLDTGLGNLNPAEPGKLLKHLSDAGVSAEQITKVLLTHGHGDHIGGGVDDAGQRTFPNAQYYMTRIDWDHWTGPARREVSDRRLFPLEGHISLLEPGTEIAPGVRVILAPGHTPGHVAVEVESQGEKLLDIVDAAHHTVQWEHPDWSPKFDFDPVLAGETRRALFDRAAKEGWRVMAYHLPFPGLGLVRQQGEAYLWEPLE